MKINSFVTYLTVFCFLCNSQITLASTTTLHSDQRIFVKTLEELIAKSDRLLLNMFSRFKRGKTLLTDAQPLMSGVNFHSYYKGIHENTVLRAIIWGSDVPEGSPQRPLETPIQNCPKQCN